MRTNYQNLLDQIGQEGFLFDELLLRHTSFKIGGPADLFITVNQLSELEAVISAARAAQVRFFILGGGTNLLVADKGFRGLVIKNKTKEIKVLGWKGSIRGQLSKVQSLNLLVDSGTPTNQLIRFCLEEGLEGLEVFLGLPGTIGGAIFGNAHFENLWFREKASFLIVMNQKSRLEKLSLRDFEKKNSQGIILSVGFTLKKADKTLLWLKAEKSLAKRRESQPLEFPSAGCIFQNISQADALRLATPQLTQSAGFLIESCGLKGKKIGRAEISAKHANFIVNLGGAKAQDVLKLIKMIKNKVFERFHLNLVEEIVKIGEF